MHHLSDKAMSDFQTAYHAAFGEELAPEEADAIGQRVLSVFRLLLRQDAMTSSLEPSPPLDRPV
jgi:hypothetical protein